MKKHLIETGMAVLMLLCFYILSREAAETAGKLVNVSGNIKEEKVTEKFSIISNRISDYRLKPRDYAVYCCLVKHSDKNGVCFPSRRLIAEECCIDKKTVDAALRSLEKAGLVKKKKRRRQDGSNTSNAYTVQLFR